MSGRNILSNTISNLDAMNDLRYSRFKLLAKDADSNMLIFGDWLIRSKTVENKSFSSYPIFTASQQLEMSIYLNDKSEVEIWKSTSAAKNSIMVFCKI